MFWAGLPARVYESLKTLCCLAAATGPLQAHEIASAAELPPAQTAKILQMMTWAGFVESRRGTKGGFWLVTPPQRIRVTDVLAFFRPHQYPEGLHPKRDPVFAALEEVSVRCQKEFEHITIADLAKLSRPEYTDSTKAAKTSPKSKQSRQHHRNGEKTEALRSKK